MPSFVGCSFWGILKPPGSNEEWKRISDGFCQAWNLPHCIGAINGNYVRQSDGGVFSNS
uniref:Uncharacterized protein n=1 Tax=Amphimedon queenslandica TaxID=400682 RepID=A0A1X7UJR8_AMPQE